MDKEISVLEVLERITSGQMSPKAVNARARRACVETLYFQGRTIVSLAKLFQVCDRTIRRDVETINQNLDFSAIDGAVRKLLGRVYQQVGHEVSHLVQTSRDRLTPAKDRIAASKTAIEILCRVVGLLDRYANMVPKLDGETGEEKDNLSAYSEIPREVLEATQKIEPIERTKYIKIIESFIKDRMDAERSKGDSSENK